tara:strand:- start:54 stop:470 length:417 start_codon:yes stop_codon:yes gene_type:complete
MTASSDVRIFLSSTFLDMVQERKAIQSMVLPYLQNLANERQIHLSLIDLRWGLDNISSNSVSSCLEEVGKATYFIGMFGDRYGFSACTQQSETEGERVSKYIREGLQDAVQSNPALRSIQQWAGLENRSVTELEVRCV